jgi:hypothetical protein
MNIQSKNSTPANGTQLAKIKTISEELSFFITNFYLNFLMRILTELTIK